MSEIEEVVRQLTALREGQQARVDHARRLLQEAEGEMKRLDAMLTAAGVKTTPARRRTKGEGGISSDAVESVRRAIREATWDNALSDLPGSFTVKNVTEALSEPMAASTIRRALDVMRAEGEIRMAGSRVIGGTRPSIVFVKEASDG